MGETDIKKESATGDSSASGVLVLLCRSRFADNFSWFRTHLSTRLRQRFGDRVHFVDVTTSAELVANLLNPVTLFDIGEVHILAEYEQGRLNIDAARNLFIRAGEVAVIRESGGFRVEGGEILPDAIVNVWYLSHSQRPTMEMLNEWNSFFGRRCFFLPLAQLKNQIRPRPAREKAAITAPVRNAGPRSPASMPDRRGVLAIFLILAVIGGIGFFSKEAGFDSRSYYRTVSHRDSPADIAALTDRMDSGDGVLAGHSWIFRRTRWDFTFFVAREWLLESEAELRAASVNPGRGDRYWANVYRRIARDNDGRLDNVVSALRDHGHQMELDDHDMASFVLSFVQHIRYRIPGNRLELLAPPQTVRERYGDCDSKSLLYVHLLRELGYDVAMFVNRSLSHAMAGVATAATGTYKSDRGVRYYFVETTGVGHRIGQLAAKWGSLGNWVLIPL